MKKLTIGLFAVALAALMGCHRTPYENKLDLSVQWKFHIGDDISWSGVSFDDAKWDLIKPTDNWENQGYKNLDGFAWYRIRIIIPRSLIYNAYIKDSLQIKLGKIDDYDQVFLNGELIGENAKVMPVNTEPRPDFFKGPSQWDVSRRYVLAANDARIHWDKEMLFR